MMRSRPASLVACLALAALGAGVMAAPQTAAGTESGQATAVIVQAADAQTASEAVARHGGEVERQLELIGAAAADVTPATLTALQADPTVTVTQDIALEFTAADPEVGDGNGTEQLQALNPGDTWSTETGSGVGVALLDTGVTEVAELAGRVIPGPDYSDEGHPNDSYGHGTFMAGLIAGNGGANGGDIHGVAPGAHIVSVKLAGRDGVTSLSKVLDAIGWVVVNQDEFGIRVLNLSLGVPTNRAPQADPLSAAVQAAWASGITVVAASGNNGSGTVTSPGRDPWIITVGSTDTNGTAVTHDDTVPDWSGAGRVNKGHKPDVLAPGTSVLSLRTVGSHIDEEHPQARIGEGHFRGSGTSMSAAMVSGAVAALAEFRPYATPDDFKGALVTTGAPITGSIAPAVDLAAADEAPADADWRQDHPIAFKGLAGHVKRGMPWAQDGAPSPDETWARMAWADGEWTRMAWARMAWADAEFTRMAWARMAWADANFARMAWADENFTRMAWARMAWARMAWAGSNWSGDRSWVGVDWTASRWDGAPTR
ncbi:MAG: S8 family serine peptidase [Actinobacteria bacterium]|jgi:serine protease AprX|nr:S8 family serine peptidase [Actinomycetota bacterium]